MTTQANFNTGEKSLEAQRRNQLCLGTGNQESRREFIGKKEFSSQPEENDSGETLPGEKITEGIRMICQENWSQLS